MIFSGKKLTEIRKSRKITQKELSEKTGISTISIIRYEGLSHRRILHPEPQS
jgi:transcriptional regulator with XRE-family HTH domain